MSFTNCVHILEPFLTPLPRVLRQRWKLHWTSVRGDPNFVWTLGRWLTCPTSHWVSPSISFVRINICHSLLRSCSPIFLPKMLDSSHENEPDNAAIYVFVSVTFVTYLWRLNYSPPSSWGKSLPTKTDLASIYRKICDAMFMQGPVDLVHTIRI